MVFVRVPDSVNEVRNLIPTTVKPMKLQRSISLKVKLMIIACRKKIVRPASKLKSIIRSSCPQIFFKPCKQIERSEIDQNKNKLKPTTPNSARK
jgi:hypothetical protein